MGLFAENLVVVCDIDGCPEEQELNSIYPGELHILVGKDPYDINSKQIDRVNKDLEGMGWKVPSYFYTCPKHQNDQASSDQAA